MYNKASGVNNQRYRSNIMDLLSAEKTINKKSYITLARDLTLDDVNIKPFANFPVSHRDANSMVYQGAYISLKPSIIQQLIEHAGVQTSDSGKLLKSGSLGRITDGWRYSEPTRFQAIAEETVRYTGRRTPESKQSHLEGTIETVKLNWEQTKDEKMALSLKDLQSTVQSFLESHAEKINESLHNIVVEQNVNSDWFDNNLSDKDKQTVATNDSDIVNYEAEIEKLKKAISAKRTESYKIKRSTIEKKIMTDPTLGEQTKEAIAGFSEEEKSEDHEMFMY